MRKDVRKGQPRIFVVLVASGGMLWNVVKQVAAYGRNVSFCNRDIIVCLFLEYVGP